MGVAVLYQKSVGGRACTNLRVETYFAIKRGGCYPKCHGGDVMSAGVVRVVFAPELEQRMAREQR